MPRKPSGASFSAAAPRCGRRRRHLHKVMERHGGGDDESAELINRAGEL